MIRVLFLTRCLEAGGAERQLLALANGLDKRCFQVALATFYDGGSLAPEAATLPGVRLVSLHKKNRHDLIGPGYRLLRLLSTYRPHVVHGYMSVANEVSLAAGRAIGARVVWGLRSSNVDLDRYDWLTAASFQLSAGFSRWVDLLIVNSHAGKRYHLAKGYRGQILVIPNGICLQRFHRNHSAGQSLRARWGLSTRTRLVGIVARLDPMKDHSTFLRSASILAPRHPDLHFVCVGSGPASYKEKLVGFAAELGLAGRVSWKDAQPGTEQVYNALDVLVSSSAFGEGTSNVVGEAMASELPCVVTDVGDSARLVESIGKVVPPANPEFLAAATEAMLSLSPAHRAELGRAARERVISNYSVSRMVSHTEDALRWIVGSGR